MIVRRLGLLPLLVAAVALGRSTDSWQLGVTIAGVGSLLALIGPRWELDRGRQLVMSAMGAGGGYALVPVLYDPQPGALTEGWTRFGAAVALAAAARFPVVRPEGGRMVTNAFLFASLVAAGETHVSGYPGLVVLFLAASLFLPGSTSEDDSLSVEPTGRRLVVGAAICVVGAALAAGMTVGLRAAYTWITKGARASALAWTPRTGFSDQMDLGALDGLLDSDRIVLRVRGPRVDYLRGAAFDFYAAGQWLRSERAETVSVENYANEIPSSDEVEITAVSERTERFFLPLDARLVIVSPLPALIDGLGAVKKTTRHGLGVARFVMGERDWAKPMAPGRSDLQVPRSIRDRITHLADEWTRAEETPSAKLDAIERRLRSGYHYARSFQRVGGTDPAVDFLLTDKSGHCEYFATAMVLVARAAGIPARMVTGYRVGEQSPFGYYVVRERNAHAWVEAWIAGRGWSTRDPTPEVFLPQNRDHRAGYAASVADGLRVGFDDLTDWLRRLTLEQTAIAWGIGFVVLLWIVARGARRGIVGNRGPVDEEAALPCLAVLLSALESHGQPRHTNESLERLAARVGDPNAARLLERYSAFRYGSIGNAVTLSDDIQAYVRALQAGDGSTAVAESSPSDAK